jgi:hypothetical protein
MQQKGLINNKSTPLLVCLRELTFRYQSCYLQESCDFVKQFCRKKDLEFYDSDHEDDLKDSIHLTRDRMRRIKRLQTVSGVTSNKIL